MTGVVYPAGQGTNQAVVSPRYIGTTMGQSGELGARNQSVHAALESCVFCRMIAGIEPVSLIIQNVQVLALMSLFPTGKGHALVVPRRHYGALDALDEAVGTDMFRQARRLAICLRNVVRCDWVELSLHDAMLKGRHLLDPYHLHLHVLPRRRDRPLTDTRPDGRAAMAPREELERLALKIGANYTSRFGPATTS